MAIERMVRSEQRRGRSFSQPLVDPLETRRILLQQYEAANYYGQQDGQVLRKGNFPPTVPSKCCSRMSQGLAKLA